MTERDKLCIAGLDGQSRSRSNGRYPYRRASPRASDDRSWQGTVARNVMLGGTFREDGPRTRGGLFLSAERPAARRRSCADLGVAAGERQPCLRTIPSVSSPSGKPTGNGTRPSARSTSTRPGPSSTSSTCSPIPAAPGCTSAIPKATPPPISSAATSGCAAITCCIPWAGMPSACPPSNTPSRTTSIPGSPPRRTSTPSAARSSRWASRTTGTARSTPPTPIITTGRSGSSCNSTTPGTTPTSNGPTAGPSRQRQGPADRRAADPAGNRRPDAYRDSQTAGLSGRGAGQLVPGPGNRAGQRRGHRRQERARRLSGRPHAAHASGCCGSPPMPND